MEGAIHMNLKKNCKRLLATLLALMLLIGAAPVFSSAQAVTHINPGNQQYLDALPHAAPVTPPSTSWWWRQLVGLTGLSITGVTWEAGCGWFETIDEAALDWALTFVPRTIEEDAEFGAIIYRRFDWRTLRWGYSYSQTIRGLRYSVFPVPPLWMVFFPFMAAGAIHTHPYGSSTYFSQQDLDSANFLALLAHYSYVAGPCGSVRRYDARTRTFELIHDATSPESVLRAVADYNENHGGTGELIATVTGPREVTITGEVIGTTWPLEFMHNTAGISIILDATIKACPAYPPWALVASFRRSGTVEVAGGVLRVPSEAPTEVAITSHDPYHTLIISGGAVYGNVIASTLSVTGGTIDNDRFISTSVAHISPEVDVVLTHPQYVIWANADFTEFTVSSDEIQLNRHFRLGPGQTLTILENAAMQLWLGNLILDGGTLVIDGELTTMPEEHPDFAWAGELRIISGTITGANAGDLAGVYEAGEPPSFIPAWIARLPRWLDFILRYYAFGWWWFFLV